MSMLNEHLEHHIAQKLMANDELSSQRIEVKVANGSVTLQGEVQSCRRKLMAQEIVESDDHVGEVLNELVVAMPDVEYDATICLQIDDLLNQDNAIAIESIHASCRDGKTTLTGYVMSEHEKLRVADIASSVDGVLSVNNLLIANPDQVLANRDHCQKILDSVSQVIGMEHEDIRLSVVHDTARLSGNVDSIWKKEAAENVVRKFGILNVANEIVTKP